MTNNELPADGEWFHSDGADKFHEACEILLNSGLKPDVIKVLLSNLYAAVASEFGS